VYQTTWPSFFAASMIFGSAVCAAAGAIEKSAVRAQKATYARASFFIGSVCLSPAARLNRKRSFSDPFRKDLTAAGFGVVPRFYPSTRRACFLILPFSIYSAASASQRWNFPKPVPPQRPGVRRVGSVILNFTFLLRSSCFPPGCPTNSGRSHFARDLEPAFRAARRKYIPFDTRPLPDIRL
jgi:hypothetical protein